MNNATMERTEIVLKIYLFTIFLVNGFEYNCKKMVNSYVWFHRDIQQFKNSCINENFSDDKAQF